MILEGERIIDSANQLVDSAETKEVKLRKEHKKLKKVKVDNQKFNIFLQKMVSKKCM